MEARALPSMPQGVGVDKAAYPPPYAARLVTSLPQVDRVRRIMAFRFVHSERVDALLIGGGPTNRCDIRGSQKRHFGAGFTIISDETLYAVHSHRGLADREGFPICR